MIVVMPLLRNPRAERPRRLAVLRRGPVSFLRCGWCGRTGDIEREVEDLSASGIHHVDGCRVADTLLLSWRFTNGMSPSRACA